jgi:hypothetical protein
MPASWVKDEKIWEKAKDAYEESYPEGLPEDRKWPVITTIYKNMGGSVAALRNLIRNAARRALSTRSPDLARSVAELHRAVKNSAK